MSIPFFKYCKIYYTLSGILILASLISLTIFGLKLGADLYFLELMQKARVSIILALLFFIVYIAFIFRKISWLSSSWQIGIVAFVTLFHDGLITLGAFSILGKFYGVQITIPVICGLFVIFSYSIINKIALFSQIQENIFRKAKMSYQELLNKSLNQAFSRQIKIFLTTLPGIIAIFFYGGEGLRYFALILMIGISVGTYSSLFLASSILVELLR